MLQLGLRLHDAEKLPIEELLPIVREKGCACIDGSPENEYNRNQLT